MYVARDKLSPEQAAPAAARWVLRAAGLHLYECMCGRDS